MHRLAGGGAFMVTCGTYEKAHFFDAPERRTLLQDALFSLADRYGWSLQAWALFSNHYHFVAMAPDDARGLPRLIAHLHTSTSSAVNKLDAQPGRKVWHQYCDTHLTYEKSYYARLKYVHNNALHHGLVVASAQYPWCSASWFRDAADLAFYRTVQSFKTDRLAIPDDFLTPG